MPNEIRIDSIIQGHVEADLKTRTSQTIPRKADLDKVSFVYDLSGSAINESKLLIEDSYSPVGSAGFSRTVIKPNDTVDSISNTGPQHAKLFLVSSGIFYTPVSIAADAGKTLSIQLRLSPSNAVITNQSFLLSITQLQYYVCIYDFTLLKGYSITTLISRDAGTFPAATGYTSYAYGIGRLAGRF